MLKVKGFSYDIETDKDVIDHIKTQPNGSRYVWNLVRKDMNKESIEVIIRREIDKYLEGVEIKSKERTVEINQEELMNILQM